MRLKLIDIDYFGSYGEEVILPLENRGLVLVLGDNRDSGGGSNGAGKSFLIDALQWCLFGKTQRGLLADEVKNRNSDEGAWVCVELQVNNKDYIIERYRDRFDVGGSGVRVYSGDARHEYTKASVNETNKFIQELIGMDFDLFNDTVVITGDRVSKFITGTDSERKKVLSKILRYDELDKVLDVIKFRISELNYEKTDLEATKRAISASLTNYRDSEKCDIELGNISSDLDECEKLRKFAENKITDINNEIEGFGFDLNRHVFDGNVERRELAVLTEKRKNLIADTATNEEVIVEYSKRLKLLNEKLAKICKDFDDINNQMEKVKSSIISDEGLKELETIYQSFRTTNDELDRLTSERDKFFSLKGKTVCPTCGQKVDAAIYKKVLGNVVGNIAAIRLSLEELIKQAQSIDGAFGYSLNEKEFGERIALFHKTKNTMLIAAGNTFNMMENEKSLKADIKDFTEKIKDSNKKIADNLVSSTMILNKICKLRDSIDELDEAVELKKRRILTLKTDEQSLTENLKGLQDQINELVTRAEIVKVEKETYLNLHSRYDDASKEINDIHDQLSDFSILSRIFGLYGIRVKRMEEVLPFIEFNINKYLAILSRESVKVSIEFDGKEKCNLVMDREGLGKSSFAMLSSGEKKRVMAAAVFALGELVGLLNDCNLLWLDEADTGLDSFGQEALVEALGEFKNHKPDIFVITHSTGVKSSIFDDTILVVKESGLSRLEMM